LQFHVYPILFFSRLLPHASANTQIRPSIQLHQRLSLPYFFLLQQLAMAGIPPPPRHEAALRQWFSQLNIPSEQFHADCAYLFGPQATVLIEVRVSAGRFESRVRIRSYEMEMRRMHDGGAGPYGFGNYWISCLPILRPTLEQVIMYELYWIHDAASRIRAHRAARGYV